MLLKTLPRSSPLFSSIMSVHLSQLTNWMEATMVHGHVWLNEQDYEARKWKLCPQLSVDGGLRLMASDAQYQVHYSSIYEANLPCPYYLQVRSGTSQSALDQWHSMPLWSLPKLMNAIAPHKFEGPISAYLAKVGTLHDFNELLPPIGAPRSTIPF